MPGKQSITSNRGSMTIEAAILFSLIFFCIMATIYAGMLLYQQAYLQTLVNRTAHMGALTWHSPQSDMYIGQRSSSDLNNKDLYWRIIDVSKDDKRTKVLNYINFPIKAYDLLNTEPEEITASIENNILYSKLIVRASQTYYLPMGKLLRFLGLDEALTLRAEGTAIIKEPAEFIRTTDFVVDTGKELDRRTGGHIQNSGESIGKKISGMLDKVREFLQKYQ